MRCYTCKGHHLSAIECRQCYRDAYSNLARHVVNTEAAPTEAQINYITSLGGDGAKAVRMTRAGASGYIEGLKAAKAAKGKQVTTPAKRREYVPASMLEMVPTGYYAVQASPIEPLVFIRLTRPTTGQYNGCIKVQTQHSETLRLRFLIWPNGRQELKAGQFNGRTIDFYLKLLLSTHRAASIMYGREIQSCCMCGKTLTDPRSRHYCIGPECEKKYGEITEEIMAEVEEVYGQYVEEVHV